MKSKSKINKALGALMTLVLLAGVTAVTSVVSAVSALEAVFPTTFLQNGRFNIASIVGLVFQIILYAAILWTVWNVVLAGIKIAGAKEDADKRKEGIQAVINAVIGLVVALLAWGIVSTVTSLIGADISNIEITQVPCVGKASGSTTTFTGVIEVNNGTERCVNNQLNLSGDVISKSTP